MNYRLLFLNNTTILAALTILLLSIVRIFEQHFLDGYFEVFLLVLSGLFLYQFNKINKSLSVKSQQQEKLLVKTDELEYLISSFDRNVIFSKTDLNGIITHVSNAFCDRSEHETDELIGQPHNIERHPDMESVAFKDMWETL